MNWARVGGIGLLTVAVLSGCATAPAPSGAQEPAVENRVVIEASFREAVETMNKGNISDARSRFRQMVQAHPGNAGPMANLGIIAFREGESDAARVWFERVLEVNPQHVVALNHLGVIARNAGAFAEAEQYYRAALAADPDYAPVVLNLAFLLDIYLGKPADAVPVYEHYQAVVSEPDPRLDDWIFDAKNRM